MASPKKNKDEKDPATIQPVKNEPPAQETKPDITIVNVSSDNDILAKLDLQEKEETKKLEKVVLPPGAAATVNLTKLGNGMVAYWDNKLGIRGSEKANILHSMIKFNKERYRLL